jgi:hypothetical protein
VQIEKHLRTYVGVFFEFTSSFRQMPNRHHESAADNFDMVRLAAHLLLKTKQMAASDDWTALGHADASQSLV